MQILQYFPGTKVTIWLEVTADYVDGYDGYDLVQDGGPIPEDGYDGYGGYDHIRMDSPTTPFISRIFLPSFALAPGYPANMTRVDTGLYYYQFTLPTGASAIGTYLVDVSYSNPINGLTNVQAYQVLVTAPFGNFSTTIGI